MSKTALNAVYTDRKLKENTESRLRIPERKKHALASTLRAGVTQAIPAIARMKPTVWIIVGAMNIGYV
jgi:hypothetical protein